MSGYPLIGFGPLANCTLNLCPVKWSVFQYQPSIAANSAFVAIFGILLAVQVFQGIRYKTWGHTACVAAGNILQIVGYIGRLLLHGNPFSFNAFLIQIICITIAPVFYCAAVYAILSQYITITDVSVSRFNPRLFYWIFIPADITCLVLQATGGGLSATAYTPQNINVGVSVTKAGLILQVILLVLFLSLFTDYLFASRRTRQTQTSNRMRIFLFSLGLTVIFILIRCLYRIVELKDGYFGPNFRRQPEFIGLEGAVMCLAVVFLIISHPGPVFQHSEKVEQETIALQHK